MTSTYAHMYVHIYTCTHRHLCISHIWAQMDRLIFLILEGKDSWFGLLEGPSNT